MQVHRIEKNFVVGLHHFFEAEVMTKFCVTDEVRTTSLHLQKNATSLRGRFPSQRRLLPQMPFGVERPRNVGEKSIGVGRAWRILFLSRWHVRLRGRAERGVGGTVDRLHKSSIGALARGSGSGVRLFNIRVLCNPQHHRKFFNREELHNASLCYLAWGVSFVARVFDRAVGAAL